MSDKNLIFFLQKTWKEMAIILAVFFVFISLVIAITQASNIELSIDYKSKKILFHLDKQK